MATKQIDYAYYTYTADDGATKYSVRLDKFTGDNADLGFEAMDTTKPLLPRQYKMRYALLIDPVTGNRRKRPIGTNVADIATGAQTTIAMQSVADATPDTFQVTLVVGERRSRAHNIFNL
jgi:hypothetical protein